MSADRLHRPLHALISHRIATRRYPLTLVYGAYGGWDGVLGVLFGASVLVSRRAFCTQTPICFCILQHKQQARRCSQATVGFAWLLLRGENGAQLRAARAKKDA